MFSRALIAVGAEQVGAADNLVFVEGYDNQWRSIGVKFGSPSLAPLLVPLSPRNIGCCEFAVNIQLKINISQYSESQFWSLFISDFHEIIWGFRGFISDPTATIVGLRWSIKPWRGPLNIEGKMCCFFWGGHLFRRICYHCPQSCGCPFAAACNLHSKWCRGWRSGARATLYAYFWVFEEFAKTHITLLAMQHFTRIPRLASWTTA